MHEHSYVAVVMNAVKFSEQMKFFIGENFGVCFLIRVSCECHSTTEV